MEKRASEDEISGWHHRCNEHELGQTSGDGEEQGGLECYSPWSRKESDMTEQLNDYTHTHTHTHTHSHIYIDRYRYIVKYSENADSGINVSG